VRRGFGIAWYRFRTTFRQRWGGYLAIVLLVGFVGGLAMGALAAARRTQSSFPTYLASTNPSDLIVRHDDSQNDDNSTDAAYRQTIAHLPHVKDAASSTGPSVQTLDKNGVPDHDPAHVRFNSSVITQADVDGLFYDQLRPTVVEGRAADPKRADEMVMTAGAAAILNLHVGDVVPFGFYTNVDTTLPTYGTGQQTPVRKIDIKLVGIVVFPDAIVRDDFDRAQNFLLFSPALTTPLLQCCANGPLTGLQLDHGSRDVPAVESEIKQALPNSSVVLVTSSAAATAERAIRPASIALGVFGLIAALAALLIAAQVIGRHLRFASDDLGVLRSLGAGPATTSTDGLLGVLGAVAIGALLAAVVAVAVSPIAPLGPVRPVYPSRGIAFDWTVLAGGVVLLIVVLSALAITLAYRDAPHRVARRTRPDSAHRTSAWRAAAAAGMPAPAVTGIRFALEPGHGKNAVPVRSAILGTLLAIVVVVATVTFGTSLSTLVSRPALYGWNWTNEIVGPYFGFADVPQPQAGKLLDQDRNVEAWSDVSFDTFRIDGLTVPVIGTGLRAKVAPAVLSGHALDAHDQVVLGGATLAALHKHIGDTVEVDNGQSKPTRLVIVGTATLPAIGVQTSLHSEIGSGAVLSRSLIPALDSGFGDLPGSPEAILVRFRAGVDAATAHNSLTKIAHELNVLGHGPPSIVSVQRPAEIVNYGTLGSTPALLGAGLAVAAIVALGLTLVASVRRRRRDLALLKTLGFTRRQLAATVSWQSSVAVIIGIVVGVPLGIVAGRVLWDQFANQLHVVPQPTVPGLTIALIAVGALVLANIVATVPGRSAARTPTAVLLRAE
jgi:FtsX-like permease family/MacB-like periplasmic core domain